MTEKTILIVDDDADIRDVIRMRLERSSYRVIEAGDGKEALQLIHSYLPDSRAISRKPGGTGLGTKIVKDVIDIHQGTIRVESEVNRGTTFFISLPVSQRAHMGICTPVH